MKGRAGEIAKRMPTHDLREFASTKHEGLPDKKTSDKEPSKSACLALAWCLTKVADVQAALHKAEKALHQVHATRRKAMQGYVDKLQKHNEQLASKSQEADQKIREAEHKSQQAEIKAQAAEAKAQQIESQAEMGAGLPSPPPSQAPYGQMLTGTPEEQEEQGKAGGKPGLPSMPHLPGQAPMPKLG